MENQEKRRKLVTILIVAIVIVFVVATMVFVGISEESQHKTRKAQLMENIGGDLPIVALDTYTGDEISGRFTLLNGTLEGKSQTIIRFSWESRDGYYYICEIPSSSFQRVEPVGDNDLTVNFNLDIAASDSLTDTSPLRYNEFINLYSKMVTISMTDEQYSRFLDLTYSNPIQD